MRKYSKLSEKEKLKVYRFAMKLRKTGLGQNRISSKIREKLNIHVSPSTVSGWVYFSKVPGENKKTWFKPKPVPKRRELYRLYVKEGRSAMEIAKKFGVSDTTVRKWLKELNIPLRNLKEAMNTKHIKLILRQKKLAKPTKNFKRLTEDKAYILGVLCGDATITPKFVRMEIRNDEEFIKKFAKCFENVYGIKYDYCFYSKRRSFVLYVTSLIICQDLLKYGKFGCYDWKIPKSIFRCKDEDIISSFIQGFFDSEGTVGHYSISASSVNETGLTMIKRLLSKIGINSTIKSYRKKYKAIYISGKQNLKKFKEKINFSILRKKNKLENMYKQGW